MNSAISPAQAIISAMITPALLILGSGSLVATALLRLGRAVDRARAMMQLSTEEAAKQGWTLEERQRWIARYGERAQIAERSVATLFLGIGIFVLDCLSIAVDRFLADRLTWLPVSLTILGMLLMFVGAYYMVVESRLASRQIREEIQQVIGRERGEKVQENQMS